MRFPRTSRFVATVIAAGSALALAACGGNTPEPAPLPSGAARPAPTTPTEVIERMHDAYAGRWYRTLTFVQTSRFADGRVERTTEGADLVHGLFHHTTHNINTTHNTQ